MPNSSDLPPTSCENKTMMNKTSHIRLSGRVFDTDTVRLAIERLHPLMFLDIPLPGGWLRPLGIHYMDYGVGWSIRTHRHTFHEAHLILSGLEETRFTSHAIQPKAGEWYRMPPGTLHAHSQPDGSRHEGIAVRWEFLDVSRHSMSGPDPAGRFPEEHSDSSLHARPMDPAMERALVILLEGALFKEPVLAQQIALSHLAIRMMMPIHEERPEHNNVRSVFVMNAAEPSARQPRMSKSPAVQMAERFIDENLSQPLILSDIAHAVHLSSSQLTRLFRKHMGCSVMDSVREQRVCRAMHQLKCTSISVAEIAIGSGFGSISQFHAAFHHRTGVSPLQYRKNGVWLVE